MQLKSTYEQGNIHQDWDSSYYASPMQDRLNERIMDRLMKYLAPAPGARFLDAGCGKANHTFRIVRRGYRCVGIDLSELVIETARKKASELGLEEQVEFVCNGLEAISFPDDTFDCIHCRGVLMHIPDYERALGELCRVLKPGGRMVILEANVTSVETAIVRAVRRVMRRGSTLKETPGGLEFWSGVGGHPFVVRVANIGHLIATLEDKGFRLIRRLGTEFFDVYRFPDGLRGAVTALNRVAFDIHLPAIASVGNAVIVEKLPHVA